jgi:hypothetical protein
VRERVPVAWGADSPRARYALDVLLRLLGLAARDPAPGERALLAYGPAEAAVQIPAGPQDSWDEPDPTATRVNGLSVVHRPGAVPSSPGGDLLFAAYACLTAPWERVDPRNEIGTPSAAGGWLDRHGVLEEPLVHRYADALGSRLSSVGVRSSRREPALVLTHDVDEHFAHLFGVREAWTRFGRELRAGRPSAVRRAAGLVRRLARRRRTDPNDRWDEWRALIAAWRGRTAFFAASYGLFDRGAARFDVAYDVRNPEVARELRSLADAGAELGIHLSLGARQSVDRVRSEINRLRDALGLEIRSSRHHWWGLGDAPWRTLRLLSDAGLRVDCSFGFNDRAGFRRGIAAPFRPFDPEREEPLRILCLPTIAMDRAVVASPGGRERLERVLGSCCDAGGALVLDWHAHVLNPAAMPGAREALVATVAEAERRAMPLRTPLELADAAYDRTE